ncbi:MAG: site-2 protease family protein [Proteobacteria bacterium]|nr:MAG: site-2 protease family protein [Pseudomonadota bacterium]
MDFLQNIDITQTLAMILALIIAIVGHEIMHGLVAYLYGDSTAKSQNRLSPNPIRHVDLVGSIIVPALLYISKAGFLFGWAKPVPVYMPTVIANGGYFGAIAVSLAGIFYNFFLAIVSAILLHVIPLSPDDFLVLFLFYCISINVVLGFFNLLPIPPLDGFNALGFLLAWMGFEKFTQRLFLLSKYGMIILILIIATPVSDYIFAPINYIMHLLLM